MNECLHCSAPTKRKFCSPACSNKHNGFLKAQANKDDGEWVLCPNCLTEKPKNAFSFIDKWDYALGKMATCKRCNATKREALRKARTWKHDAALILLNNSKQRCKRTGMEHTINYDDIKIPDVCPVFGMPLFRESKSTWKNAPSLDRIDNSKGYTPDNIIVVSRRANILKKDASVEELIMLANFYKNLGKKK